MSPRWIALAGLALLMAVVLVALAPSSAMYVAVCLGASAYTVYTVRRAGSLRMGMVVRAVLLLVTVMGILLPALIGILNLSSLTLARVADSASLGDLLVATL